MSVFLGSSGVGRFIPAIVSVALMACTEPSPDPVGTGAIAASVSTGGEDLDPSGYDLRIDGAELQAIELNGSRTIVGLEAGTHLVELTGVAQNCTVVPDARRTVTVTVGETVEVTFLVTCFTTGVEVSATVTGVDLDETYRLLIDGGDAGHVVPGRPARVTRLSAGAHQISLDDLAPNCVAQANPRTVTIPTYAVLPIAFAVGCVSASGLLEVTVETSGLDRDFGGYQIEVDRVAVGGSPSRFTIPTEGKLVIAPIAVGDRRITVRNVAPNCTLLGGAQRLVTIAGGLATPDTARITISVDCRGGVWQFAFIRNGIMMVASADGSQLDEIGTGSAPAWSPDGSRLAFNCQGLCVTSTLTGRTTVLPTGPIADGPTWRPDGLRLAYVKWNCDDYYYYYPVCTFDGLYHINVDGTNPLRIPLPAAVTDATWPAWSPAGNRLAFECATGQARGICVINVDGSGFQTHSAGAVDDGGPTWKPDGTLLAFHTARFGSVPRIAVMKPDGTGVTSLGPGQPGLNPAWSPDGSRIVFGLLTTNGTVSLAGIAVMNADGTAVTQLTTGFDRTPVWRP